MSSFRICMFCLVKRASKLSSQNWLMEISALLCRDECSPGVDGGQVGHVK